jgi:TRAP-type C4-dicarboxylate transport system substrate-binding protein
MVGLVSGVRWRSLDEATRQTVTELMNVHFDRIVSTYIEAEADYESQLRSAGIRILEVGPGFFGAALGEWESEWRERAPVLEDLRRLAADDARSAD